MSETENKQPANEGQFESQVRPLALHSEPERLVILRRMREASAVFYGLAVQAGCHPFIEFAGLMNEYVKCCESAHNDGIDFTACNKHADQHLPMPGHAVIYVNEKLECIFTGRSVMQECEAPAMGPSGMIDNPDERYLRRLLAECVAMPRTYYDDGEAWGQEHGISIDFIREPVTDLDAKLCALGVARMVGRQIAPNVLAARARPLSQECGL